MPCLLPPDAYHNSESCAEFGTDPLLRTVGTLASHYKGEYDSLPVDLPLDIWVQAYDWPYNEMEAGYAAWRHSAALPGHEHRDVWWCLLQQ